MSCNIRDDVELKYPLSIFIDTNVIMNAKYDFSEKGILYQLIRLKSENKIDVYIHDIVIGEVINHLESEVTSFANAFKKIKSKSTDKLSKNIIENSIISTWFNYYTNSQIKANFVEQFLSFLAELSVNKLDSSNINVNTIVTEYLSGIAPFEAKESKKHEFPDAIMSHAIKNNFSESNPIHIISNDKGFCKSFDDYRGFTVCSKLKTFLDFVNKDEELYDSLYKTVIEDKVVSSLREKICDELEFSIPNVDGYDYDRSGIVEGFDYDETLITGVELLNTSFNSIDIITANDFSVTYNCIANIDVICTCFDSENSIWDNEDKYYIFEKHLSFLEKHKSEFECSAKYKIIREDDDINIEFVDVTLDISLDQDSRTNRKLIAEKFENSLSSEPYTTCPKCGEPISESNDALTGLCTKCEQENSD